MNSPLNPVTGLPFAEPMQQLARTQKSDKDETPIGNQQRRRNKRQHADQPEAEQIDLLELTSGMQPDDDKHDAVEEMPHEQAESDGAPAPAERHLDIRG